MNRAFLLLVAALLGCQSRREEAVVVVIAADASIDLEGWNRACARGETRECELLANQLSISTDPAMRTRSVALFERACTSGSMLGCHAAGSAFRDGRDVPKDPDKGRLLLQRGCDLGHHWACERLK